MVALKSPYTVNKKLIGDSSDIKSRIGYMKRNETPLKLIVVRQLAVSIVISFVVIAASYKDTKDIKECVKRVNYSLMDSEVLFVVALFFCVYVVSIFANHYLDLFSKDTSKISCYVYAIIRKLASNFESALQLYAGTMFAITPAWYFFDRNTFNPQLNILYFILAVGFLLSSSAYDLIDAEVN